MSDTLSARGLVLGLIESGLLSSSMVSLAYLEPLFVSSTFPGVESYLLAVTCADGGEV